MKVRAVSAGDAEAILAIYAPIVEHTSISFETVVPTIDEMRARIAKSMERHRWLVFEDDRQTVCGYVYASAFRERAAYRWSVETTAYVREDSRGKGIGKRLYRALIEDLRELGYCQAVAGIALPNAASVALHESVGFEPAGVYRKVGFKRGAWHDVGWWQLQLQEPPASPR